MQQLTVIAILILAASLQAQDKEYSEWYLQRPDVDIYVREIGKGDDTVVVVHGGFGANHDYMLDAVSGLEGRHRFVFFDQRGSLLSPTAKENLIFDKNVEDLYLLVKALRKDTVKVFCHSMGTLVCMEFAQQHPEMVSRAVFTGAVLAASESRKSVFSDRVDKQIAYLKGRDEVQQLLKPYVEKGYERIRSIDDIEKSGLSHKDLTDVWRIKFAAVSIFNVNKYNLVKGGRAYYKGEAAVMADSVNWNYDYRKVLNRIGGVTFIQGDRDFFDFDAAEHRRLLSGYPKIKLITIKNTGHNAWIDEPERFAELLKQALR